MSGNDNFQWNSYLFQLQQEAPQPAPAYRTTDNKLPVVPASLIIPYGREYHGTISRAEAEGILSQMLDGAYLVRQSCNPPGSFTLAIRLNSRGGESHWIQDLVHDGLITFYVELKASSYISRMCNEAVYEKCPYVAYKTPMAAAVAARQSEASCSRIGERSVVGMNQVFLDRLSIIQSEKAHCFKISTFKGFQWCQYCANFMWGLVNQGVKCTDCGFQAHKKCSEFAHSNCVPALKYIKNIFGTDLTTLIKAHASDGMLIPIVVEKCVHELEKREGNQGEFRRCFIEIAHMRVTGIYRMSPYSPAVQQLQIAFETDGAKLDLSTFSDTHAIASTVKLYLKMLPIPLITFQVHNSLLHSRVLDEATIADAIANLPPAHRRTLCFLMKHLKKIHHYRQYNKMNYKVLAVVFAPTLMRLPDPDPVVALRNADCERRIVEALIISSNPIFMK